jgi:Polyketide cyclase / dehydrase and lipid transport
MPRLHETVETALPLGETFAFLADFANSQVWDPGTVSARRRGSGPVQVGARYELVVKVGRGTGPMTYEVVALEPDRQVVLVGEGRQVHARDDIRFTALPSGGTRIDYTADLTLKGWMRVLAPFLGGTFRKIGTDARDGMRRALDARVAGTTR